MELTAHDAELDHDPSRVVSRFFLPGESTHATRSRVGQITDRVRSASAEQIDAVAREVVADFARRHADGEEVLVESARTVAAHGGESGGSSAQEIVLGSAFTAEFAVEGAALCNPSAVMHPSQDGLADGELRVAVSLRSIGEGHISSIGFAEAVVGGDRTWTFDERARPLVRAAIRPGEWSRAHFARALEQIGRLGDLSSPVLSALPDRFGAADLDRAIAALPKRISMRPDSREPLQGMREMVDSAYEADFDPATPLSARTLMPVIGEEDRGVEDARFVRFTGADGAVDYRAVYTAYDGRRIAPRLLTSPDLCEYASHRLVGSGARNKGMALFPRLVDGRHLAVTRIDGENLSLAQSRDGVYWDDTGVLYEPQELWELIQVGNCGAPIELEEGWLLLTHGVGPLRTYSLGALLLDLDDPSRVIGRAMTPLLTPDAGMRDGYVPRVVYSCGGIVHERTLWVPVGIGDQRIRVYSADLDELLASLTRS